MQLRWYKEYNYDGELIKTTLQYEHTTLFIGYGGITSNRKEWLEVPTESYIHGDPEDE